MEPAPAAVPVERDEIPEIAAAHAARRWPHRLSIAVCVVGLIVTAGLCTASRLNYAQNERRQVSTQAQLVAAALAVAPVDVQRRLGRAATLVSATGNVSLFAGALKPSVPAPFVGARLFHVVDGTPQQVGSLGGQLLLDPSSAKSQQLLAKATATGALTVTRLATPKAQRLGYAMSVTTLGQTYVTYAESTLPADRRLELPATSPLSDMTFAVYFGKAQTQGALIETNTTDLPLDGIVEPIPFGDQVLTAVMTPSTPLLGRFAAYVAWIIAGAGVLLTAVMAALTERLQRRRAVAEQLAAVSGELYRTQRGVAETLQTALLPQHLPRPPGLAVATRYLAGTEGIEIGGDWYDLVNLADDRLFFTIGDVSGRGLSAATMMSRLRHSITAYAVEGDDPATVLTKVSRLIDIARDGHFATALCGILDTSSGRVTFANAGHPPLVLVAEDTVAPVRAPIGPPLGVGSRYETAELTLTSRAILLAYTDGLIERRGEPVDDGVTHLCHVTPSSADLEGLLDTVLTELAPQDESQDDTAILGLQWTP